MTVVVTRRRVALGDVDKVLAFYCRFFSWMDDGIAELLHALGHPLSGLLHAGYGMPVVDTRCRYERPVALDDVVQLQTAVVAVRRTSFDIGHVMTVGGERVARSSTTHVWVARSPELRASPCPTGSAARPPCRRDMRAP